MTSSNNSSSDNNKKGKKRVYDTTFKKLRFSNAFCKLCVIGGKQAIGRLKSIAKKDPQRYVSSEDYPDHLYNRANF